MSQSNIDNIFRDILKGDLVTVRQEQRPTKQQQLAITSEQKREEIRRLTENPNEAYQARVGDEENLGRNTASEVEQDFLRMSPLELEWKYGLDVARDLRKSGVDAARESSLDKTIGRSNTEAVGDTAVAATQALLGGFSGLGSLGLSGSGALLKLAGVENDLGSTAVQLSKATQDFRETSDKMKSERAQRAMARGQAALANASRDNESDYKTELEEEGRTIAELRRFGRDFSDFVSVTGSDSAAMTNLVGEAAGSLGTSRLLTMGGIKASQALGLIGKAPGKVVRGAAASGAIAAQEAGGVYQQAALEVVSKLDGAENYTEEEKILIADEAGQIAAKTQAPIAAVAGLLVGRLVGGPVTRGRLTNIIGDMGREGLEETIQSGSGAISVNNAIRQTIDPNADLFESVGTDAAAGLLGGIGAGGIVSVPQSAIGAAATSASVAVRATKLAGNATMWGLGQAGGLVKAGAKGIAGRYDRVIETNRQASAVSSEKVKADLTNSVMSLQEGAADLVEAGPEAQDFIRELGDTAGFNPAEIDDTVAPVVRENLEGATTRMDAIERLSAVLDSSEEGSNEQLSASRLLVQMLSKVKDLTESTQATVLDNLAPNSAAKKMAQSLGAALASLKTNNQFKAALEIAQAKLVEAVQSGKIRPVDASELGTLEGQTQVNNALAVAEYAPESADLETNQRILEHADSGKIQLTPVQRQSLLASSTLIQAERDRLAANEQQGLTTTEDLVSGQIISDRSSGQDGGYPSLAQHVKRISSAYRAGDQETAAAFLQDLMLFAQHMQNKVGAINKHYARGGGGEATGEFYEALTPKGVRKFVKSARAAFVQPTNEASVRLVQTMAKEAELVTRTANDLAQIFGELEIDPIDLVELDAGLQGDAIEVSKRAATEKRTKNSQKASDRAKQKQEPKQQKPAVDKAVDNTEVEELKKQLAETQARLEALEKAKTTAEVSTAPVETETEKPTAPKPPETTAEAARPAAETNIDEVVAEAVSKALEDVVVSQPTVEPTAQEDAPVQSETAAEVVAKPALLPENDVRQFYPELARGDDNLLVKSFSLDIENSNSNLAGRPNPLDVVWDAIQNASPALVSAYENYLENVGTLKDAMQRRLQKFLKEKPGTQAEFLAGGSVSKFARGRALQITELRGDKLVYNDELLEIASIAALQWALLAKTRIPTRDEDDVYAILGVSRADAEEIIGSRETELLTQFEQGMTTLEASRSLAEMIKRYWGLKPKKNAPIGDVEGIAEGVAKELLGRLVETGALQLREPVRIVFDGNSPFEDGRSPYLFVPGELAQDDPIRSDRDMIERAVVVRNRQRADWVGAPPQEVAKTQLHNSRVEHTTEQRAAIRARQNVPFKLNTIMLGFFEALGEDGILSLFAGGVINENILNKNHRATLEGRNLTFRSAFSSVRDVAARIRQVAEEKSMSETDVPVFFEYTFNSMNRLQMLGSNTPQSSKLMREVLLPTSSKVDLSSLNSPAFTGFMMAVGQHIGVKVENSSPDAVASLVLASLGTKHANSVAGLQAWLRDGGDLPANLIETLKSELGGDATPAGVHSLMDYARWLNTDGEGRKAFESSLYLEADGKTNGPINGMALFTVGEFTAEWLENMERGGFFVGEAMAYHNREDPSNDLYKKSSELLERIMASARKLASPPVRQQSDHVMNLFAQFLRKDVTFDGENITFERGISKNPLTVTLYGSQAAGIANKMTKMLDRAITERMSEALRLKSLDPNITIAEGMFPNAENPAAEYAKFKAAVESLYENEATAENDQMVVMEIPGRKDQKLEMRASDFSLAGDQFKTMSKNIEALLVNPMVASIEQTVGKPLMLALTRIRQATQVQSLILARDFRKAVQAKIAEKKAAGTYEKASFLTKADLDEIFASLKNLAPILSTGFQNFMIANGQVGDLSEAEFSATLNDQLRTAGFVEAPADAGVRGIPSLVIGSGDGTMMQIFAAMAEGAGRTLDVFDGLNLPLDEIQKLSQRVNKAVWQSWNRNPMQGVSDTFTKFTLGADLSNLSQQDRVDLSRALFDNWKKNKPNSVTQIKQAIAKLEAQLKLDAMEIEARHNALARVDLSVDQMAAAGAPHVESGKISLTGLDSEQKAMLLNELFTEEFMKLQGEQDRVARNEAKVLSPSDIRVLADSMKMDRQQKGLLDGMLQSVADRGYRVIQGDLTQVNNFLRVNGLAPVNPSDRNVNGFMMPDAKIVALINTSPETLVHELIHAATFEKVSAVYFGEGLGANAVEQTRAVERIEALMKQFMGLDVTEANEATQQAYFDARTAIDEHLANNRQAMALNEFMAWGLANQNLVKLQSKTEATSLARIAQKLIASLRKLIFGGTNTTSVMTDMLSNLRFNTEILAASSTNQVTDVRSVFGETILYHAQPYGTDSRLEDINTALNKLVIKHLEPELVGLSSAQRGEILKQRVAEMNINSELVTGTVSKAFPMDMQQKTTFHLLMTTLKSAVELNANAMEKAGELYSHFVKVAKVETFMVDPDADDQNDRYQAREKYQLLIGNYETETDEFGRSSLMPMFLALSMVHPIMQAALRELPVPANSRNSEKTLNAWIENAGTAVMERLGNRLAGATGNEANVAEVVQALTDQIIRTAEDRRGFMSVALGSVGSGLNRVNDAVAKGMEVGSRALHEKAGKVRDNTNNSAIRLGAQAAGALAGIANQQIGAQVAEDMISAVNRMPAVPAFARELINDLVGRTESNANVYDLIKRVRDWVQQTRQQFRERLPKKIAEQFSRELTDGEWKTLYRWAKTDVSSLKQRYTTSSIISMLNQGDAIQQQIAVLENELKLMQPKAWPIIEAKARQLAVFMNTGMPGGTLLKNADAITQLIGQDKPNNYSPAQGQLEVTDMLVTLYAIEQMGVDERNTLSTLAQEEAKGMEFSLSYLDGLRKEEIRKSTLTEMGRYNSYKGFVPAEKTKEGSLIVASDSEAEKLMLQSYVRLGDYVGSDLERGADRMGYYYSPVNAKNKYQQGVLQTVQQTAGGSDIISGRTHGRLTSGVIDDPVKVRRAWRGRKAENAAEPLVPIVDGNGDVVAYERSVNPQMLASMEVDEHLGRAMGVWRGRQVEEEQGRQVNRILIERLKEVYDRDVSRSSFSKNEYMNLFDVKEHKKDAVLKDTMTSLPGHTISDIAQVFGNEFWVRRDMLNDALGYRDASVRNAFDGVSRIDPAVLKAAERILVKAFGNDAFKYAAKAEDFIKNLVTDLRVLIVVKSVIVPAANLTWNVMQLATRGVPINSMLKAFPAKISEVNEYQKTRERLVDAEAELRAAEGDVFRSQKLKAEIQEITDRHRRLSIWPLIQSGELSSISDGMLSKEDMQLSDGKLVGYFESLVDKLPQSAQTLAKYGLVTKDTALFRGLQKSIEYGDFLAKAVLYEDLIKRKGKSSEEALAAVSEEFVNYDRLPGRSRGFLEQIGLLWFWNFKLRSTKIAVSMIRNNPVHALLMMNIPFPDLFGPTGSPLSDNALSVLFDNREAYSMGFGMGINAPNLNPWYNLYS